jgi:hypothetical protein
MTGQIKSKFNNNCEFLVGVANVITCPRHKNLALPLYITGFEEEMSRVVSCKPGTWKTLKRMGLKFIQVNSSLRNQQWRA